MLILQFNNGKENGTERLTFCVLKHTQGMFIYSWKNFPNQQTISPSTIRYWKESNIIKTFRLELVYENQISFPEI